MADLDEVRQSVSEARQTAEVERQRNIEARQRINKARESLSTQRSLRNVKGIANLQRRNLTEQEIGISDEALTQRERAVDEFSSEVSNVEGQIREVDDIQRDFDKAQKIFLSDDDRAIFALENSRQKEFYRQLQDSKDAAIRATIDDLKAQGVTDAQALSEVQNELNENIGKLSSKVLTNRVNTIANRGAQKFDTVELPVVEQNPVERFQTYTQPSGVLPLVSAKSINISDSSGGNGLGSVSGNNNGQYSSLGSEQLNISSNRSGFGRYIDTVKTVFAQKTGQTEVPTKLGGVTTVQASPITGQTIQVTRQFTPEESVRIEQFKDFGVRDTLEAASRKVGRVTTNIFTDIATPTVINPKAGQFGQGLFTRGSSTDTLFTIPGSAVSVPRSAIERRGTTDYSVNANQGVFFAQQLPERKVTAETIGTIAGKTAQTVVRAGPYAIPYVGAGLYATEVGETLVPNIQQSGFKQGILTFTKENPADAVGLFALGGIGAYKGFNYLNTPLRTAIAPRTGVTLASESYKIVPGKSGRGMFYQAEQTYNVPKTFVREDTRLKKVARGTVDLLFGEVSPSKFISTIQPKRIQVSPTITTKYSLSSPVTATGETLSLRGAVRTERTLPENTKFANFNERDVADKLFAAQVRKGFDFYPGLDEVQGKVTGGVVQSIVLPAKELKAVRGNSLLFREEGRFGGKRLMIRPEGVFTLFKPTTEAAFVKAQRIPFVNEGKTVFAESLTLEAGLKSFDVKRFRQGSRPLDFNPIKRELTVSPDETFSKIDIAYPRKQTNVNFLPVRQETGLPPPSNIIIDSKAGTQNLLKVENTAKVSEDLVQFLPSSTETINLGKPTLTVPKVDTVVKSGSGSADLLVERVSKYTGKGKFERMSENVLGQETLPTVSAKVLDFETPKTETSLLSVQKTPASVKVKNAQVLDLGQTSVPRLSTPSLSRTSSAERTAQKTNSAQLLRLGQKAALANLLKAKARSRATAQRIKTPLKPKTPFLPPTKNSVGLLNRVLGNLGFKAFAKRGGKIVEVGSFETAGSAFKGLKKDLLSDLSASGYVTGPTGKKIKVSQFTDLKFRTGKRDESKLVQSERGRGGRLTTFGERRQIQSARKGKRRTNGWNPFR